MSTRGPGLNAGRNRGGRVGADGLRHSERELLAGARAGEALAPEHAVVLLERIAKMRHGHARALARQLAVTPGAALAEAYDELGSAFVYLLTARAVLAKRLARALRDIDGLMGEIRRLRDERDEYRDAAREADGRRMALYRVMGAGGREDAAA